MKLIANLHKMRVKKATPVDYFLDLNEEVYLNELIGQVLIFRHTGNIFCIQCGRKTKKSFQQGYCFVCLRRLQECNLCLIHPERCRVEEINCDPNDWPHRQCAAPHIVYLANSSALKIGITRDCNIPSRWIDQGACQAIALFSTQNRYQAGMIEVGFKKYIADKTNWRMMLSQNIAMLNMSQERDRLLKIANEIISSFAPLVDEGKIRHLSEDPLEFHYPVKEYPNKIVSLSLDKTPQISAKLLGIKGQYIYLDCGVMNIRKFNGYEVEFAVR